MYQACGSHAEILGDRRTKPITSHNWHQQTPGALLMPYSRVLLEKQTRSQLVKKFPTFYGTRNVDYRIHKCPTPVTILNQTDPVHGPTSNLVKINLYITLPSKPWSPKWSLSLMFPHQNPACYSPSPHTRYMPSPSHTSLFYRPNNIGWWVQIIQLLIM